jgi:hypothetical protein
MLGFSIALLLLDAAAQAANLPDEEFNPEAAVRRVRACGFAHVEMKVDDVLQEGVVVVSSLPEASDEQLRCAADASLATFTFVEFPQPLDERYQLLYVRVAQERYEARARAWLDRRGILAKLPVYVEGKSDRHAVERKIEELCGPKAKGQLTEGKLFADDDPDALSIDEETFQCVFNAAEVSGLRMRFVGNEYYPSQQPNK